MVKNRGALLVLLLLTAYLSTACVSNRTIAANAVSYNLAVERAQNRMLFLNIIRASNRSPTYLTDVSKVTGSIKADVTASLAYMFGGHGDYKNSGTPGATYSLNPTFDVNVLSTQEFMRGFLQPINNETLGYYLDQGWPPELLLHLFVREVRVRVPDGRETIGKKEFNRFLEFDYNNYPDASDLALCELYQFSRWIFDSLLKERDLRVKGTPSISGGPVDGVGGVGDLEALVNALREGLSVENVKGIEGKYRLEKIEKEFHLHVVFRQQPVPSKKEPPAEQSVPRIYTVPKGCSTKPEAKIDLVEIKKKSDKKGPTEEDEAVGRQEEKGEMRVEILGQPQVGAEPKEEEVTLVMRSPEAVMYYLGELMRVEMRGKTPEVCIQGRFQPIFFAQEEDGNCPPAVEADYEKEDYIIPASAKLGTHGASGKAKDPSEPEASESRCMRGDFRISENARCVQSRSMQALSLLSQLIALQKSAKDLPTTDVVRVVGQ